MDFVVARGFRVPFPFVFDHSAFRIGAAPTLISDGEVSFATSHAPARSGDLTLVFDGHAFDHDLFLHHASARPEDVSAAAALLAIEDRALARLDREARDILPGLASRFGGGPRGTWVPTGVDPEGLDLAADGGRRSCRVPFPAPVLDGPSLQATIVGLILDDRSGPASATGPKGADAPA